MQDIKKGRIRYLEKELRAAREEINSLKPGNNSRKNEDQDISDDLSNWSKLKNSKYRSCTFSADDVPHVKLNNTFSVLDVD
jgi:hypothetical protein